MSIVTADQPFVFLLFAVFFLAMLWAGSILKMLEQRGFVYEPPEERGNTILTCRAFGGSGIVSLVVGAYYHFHMIVVIIGTLALTLLVLEWKNRTKR